MLTKLEQGILVIAIYFMECYAVRGKSLRSAELVSGASSPKWTPPDRVDQQVVVEGSQAALGVVPAFEGLFASPLKPETDAANAETRAIRGIAQGIRISH